MVRYLKEYNKFAYTKSRNAFFISVRPPLSCTWPHKFPLCFTYQYRSTDTPVNMSLGVIFGNTPGDLPGNDAVGSWWCTHPYVTYGDCMVCSNSKYDDNLLDGLSPSVLWYSYTYSYACERENIPDSEIVDGTTNFEYRQEVCGNAPKPDNTNISSRGSAHSSRASVQKSCSALPGHCLPY